MTVLDRWIPEEYQQKIGPDKQSVLIAAAHTLDEDRVIKLLSLGVCNVNQADATGRTALHYASQDPAGIGVCHQLTSNCVVCAFLPCCCWC
jgi:hypothetical protein